MSTVFTARRDPTQQIPVVLEVPVPYTGRDHRATGILCPSCGMGEIVYNGNYFCGSYDDGWCKWALPHYDFPVTDEESGEIYDEPVIFWNLVDMLVLVGCAGGRRDSRW